MTHNADSKICKEERMERRRNSARGRKCDKGTIPQFYGHVEKVEEILPEETKRTWIKRLGARLKTFFS